MHANEYIGDGVYAARDDIGRIVLTTGHHDPRRADNVVVFEPEVWTALLAWVQRSTTAKEGIG